MSHWRVRIAAALDEVDGLTGYVIGPDVVKAGDSWPVWLGGDYTTLAGGLVNYWEVVVALPNPTLETSIDAAHPLVVDVTSTLVDLGETGRVIPDHQPIASRSLDPSSGIGQQAQEIPVLRWPLSTIGKGDE